MNNVIMLKTSKSKNEVIERLSSLSGNKEVKLSALFSGTVHDESFRLNRTSFLVHPFIPVAIGQVKSVGNQTLIELTFSFPWLGHISILVILFIILSMPLPDSLSWQIIGFILFGWGLLMYKHKKEKIQFLSFFKDKVL